MDLLLLGLETILNPVVLLWIMFGVTVGVIFGALPGVSATMSIALCISFTYTMDPVVAIAFLAAVYCAAITGGSITAILFKIPGTPSSAATTLDGYPMVLRGEAGKALSVSLICSGLGGLFAAIVMFIFTQPLMKAALNFGSPEMFAVCFLGLSILIFIDTEHKINTFASALIGMWVGTVGMDYFSSVPRFTFGSGLLLNGIEDLPFMLGMFAAVEVFSEINKPSDKSEYESENAADISKLASIKEMWELKWTILRSGAIGTVVGILPGAGASIASWLSYSTEYKFSKDPDYLGKGDPHGVAASETANNAATGGAMVPLLAMGIPGSNAAAMMMAALAIHGVQMGPMLLQAQPQYLSATFLSMAFANVFMIFISLIIAKVFTQILKVPYYVLGPFILVLALTGTYSFQGSIADVFIMIGAGIFGYFFKKYGFNAAALILGLVLGPMTEKFFRRGMSLNDNNIISFFSSPVVLVIFAIFFIMYGTYFYGEFKKKKQASE